MHSRPRSHRPLCWGGCPVVVLLPLLVGACPDAASEVTSDTQGSSSSDSSEEDPETMPSMSVGEPATSTTGTTGSSSDGTTSDTTSTTTDATTTLPDTTTDDTTSEGTTSGTGSTTGGTTDADEPVCGDKIVDPGEGCDLGEKNGEGVYGGCNEDCTPQPACKDGEYQAEFEECDPSDPELAEAAVCTDACTWDGVIVFVSSLSTTGGFGGLDGADTICQDLAEAAGLVMPEQYRAWLSVGGDNPAKDRVPLVADPYYRLDGKKIALNSTGLLGAKLLNPLNVTETKGIVGQTRVWTNTQADGTTASTKSDCQSFSSPEETDTGRVGLVGKTDGTWTDTGGLASCQWYGRLYCFSAAF